MEPIILPPELQLLVDHARNDVGEASRLDAVATRLEPQLSTVATVATAPSHPMRYLVRVLLGAIAAGVVTVVAVVAVRRAHRPIAQPAPKAISRLPQAARTEAIAPALLASESPNIDATPIPSAPSPPPRSSVGGPTLRHAAPVQPTASSAAPDPIVQEHEILAQARRSLDSDPASTLARVAEHQSRFPNGTLASEREFLRIVALERLGRTSEARAARDAFVARWPTSAYRSEIDRQLGP